MPSADDKKVSQLTAATPTALDYLPFLDVSDTDMGPSGSTRKMLISSLLALTPAPDLSGYMLKSANLSDLGSAAAARTNLGGTTVGAGLFTAASESAARALINAARTDGANTFTGLQTVLGSIELSGTVTANSNLIANAVVQGAYFADLANTVAYVQTATDSTHAWTLFNRTSTKTALTLQGASGQSRPLLELQTSLGASVGSWAADGSLITGPLTVRQIGGTAGTDQLELSHNGTRSLIESKDGVLALKTSVGTYSNAVVTERGGGVAALASDSGSYRLLVDGVLTAVGASTGWQVDATGNLYPNNTGFQLTWGNDFGIVRSAANVGKLTNGSTGYGALTLGANTSAIVPVTINLASGQTAAAISILDSLGAGLLTATSAGNLRFTPNNGRIGYATNDAMANFTGVECNSNAGRMYAIGTLLGSWDGNAGLFSYLYHGSFGGSHGASNTVLTVKGATSQTGPLNAWQLVSSTGATQVAADTYSWTNSPAGTFATRTPRIVRSITDYGGERTYMQVDTDGAQNRVSLFSAVSTGLTIESVAIGTDDRTRLRHSGGSAGFVFRATGTIASDGVLQAPYLAAGSLAWYGSEAYGAGSYNHLRIVPSSVSGASAAIDLIALRYADSGYPTVRFSANGYTFNSGNSTGWPSGNGVQYGTPTLTETGTGNWTFTARTSGTVPLSVVLASGQTANGIEQRTSLGAVNFWVNAKGSVKVNGQSGEYPLEVFSIDGLTSLFRVVNTTGDTSISGTFESVSGFRVTAFGAYAGVLGGTRFVFNSSSIDVHNRLNLTAGLSPASMADASAVNNTIYYSTDAGKLVYKDSGGTVNNLY